MEEQNWSKDLLAIKKLEVVNCVFKKEGICILLTIIAEHIIAKIDFVKFLTTTTPSPTSCWLQAIYFF